MQVQQWWPFFSAFPGTGALSFQSRTQLGFQGVWILKSSSKMRCISWTASPDQGSCSFLVGSKHAWKRERRMSRVRWRWWKEVSKMIQSRTNAGVDMDVLWCCTATEFHSPLSGICPKCISIAPSTFALQRHLFLDKAGISWLSIYAYKVGPWVSSGQTSSFCNAYYLLALKSSTIWHETHPDSVVV